MGFNERLGRVEFTMNPNSLGSFGWLPIKFVRFMMEVGVT
jgi:hypothetical protein